MAPNIQVYNSAGSAIITAISFTGHSAGIASAAQTFRFVNDDSGGAVDTATDPAIIIRAEDGTGALVTSGVRALDERWLEAKLTGNGTAAGIVATGWAPIGRNRWFLFPEIESGEYVEFQLRENRPGSGGSGEVVYDLQGEAGQLSQSLDLGRSETYRDGVLTGLGDSTWGELIYTSGDVVEAGTPDATVVMPDLFWRNAGGEPRVKLTHVLAINNLDSAAAALAAGEAYYAILSLASAGTITVTKGAKAATPLDPDVNAPAVPAGEILLARVERQFDGIINSGSDIANLYTRGAFQLVTSAASLNVTLGAGRAMVDNRLIRRTAETVLGLSASETSTIWLLPSGSFSVTEDASRPESGALLMYSAVTNGSGVTSVVDQRPWLGGEPVHLIFTTAVTITGIQQASDHWGYERKGYIWPFGISLALHYPGVGNTTGQIAAELEVSDGAGGHTTIYTSSATDDRRVVVDESDAEPVSRTDVNDLPTLPELLEVPSLRQLCATFVEVENHDVQNPSGATLRVTVYLV